MRHLLLAAIAVGSLIARADVYITPVATARVGSHVYVTATVLKNNGSEAVKCEYAYAISDDAKGGTLRGEYELAPNRLLLDEATLIRAGAVGTIRFDCSGRLLIAASIRESRDGGKTFESGRIFRSAGAEKPVRATTSRSITASSDLLLMEIEGKTARVRVVAKDRDGKVLAKDIYEIRAFAEQIVDLSEVRRKCRSPVVEISVAGEGALAITTQSDDPSLAALFKPDSRGRPLAAEAAGAKAIQMLGLSSFKGAPFVEPMTGHVYMRGRWYDPRTGAFLTPDPAGYRDSANLYSYCGGDPVNCSDPTGEISLKAALTDRVINEYEMRTLVLTDEEIRTIIGSQNAVKLAGPDDPDHKKHNLLRAKFILLTRNKDLGRYTAQLYELTRGVNAIQFAAETGWAIGSGEEPIIGTKVDRGDKVLELATYLAFMQGTEFVLGRLRAGAMPPRVPSMKKPPFVIGEDVQGRVAPYANAIGADYYSGAGDNVPKSAYLEHNRQIIRIAMEEGRQIVDIGPSPLRTKYPDATSPNYAMELEEIARAKYRNYVRQHLNEPERLAISNAH